MLSHHQFFSSGSGVLHPFHLTPDSLTTFLKTGNQFCIVVSSIIALSSISEEIIQNSENNWCLPRHAAFCRHSATNSSMPSL